jgi:hypothetical protein
MKRNLWVVLVAVVVAAVATFLGTRTTTPPSSTTSLVVTTTTGLPVTTTTALPSTWSAVWPTAASAVRYQDPRQAALGFATDYLHMTQPIAGPFAQGDTRSGEVSVQPYAAGPVTTVLVRQVSADASWWILGSATGGVVMSSPTTLSTVTSPLVIRGMSTAFEAVVNVSLREDDSVKPLFEGTVMGGSMGQMGPYQKTLTFMTPSARFGSLVLYTRSAKDGSVTAASVIRLRFR